MKAKIYLDFNATHPPNEKALEKAREFYFSNFANSSGLSLASQRVNKRIEEARESIASSFSLSPKQVIFTSCATESNNLLIREFYRNRKKSPFRILSSPFEHPSVAETLKRLHNAEITYLPATPDGVVPQSEICSVDFSSYDLISLIAVQNETGVIQPYLSLLDFLPTENSPFVLVDFSQGFSKLAKDAPNALTPNIFERLTSKNIFITATGHKIGAGFGAGLIILPKKFLPWKAGALLSGGNQERELRAGTHNTGAIIALQEAIHDKVIVNSYEKWLTATKTFETHLMEKLGVFGAEILGKENNGEAIRAPGTTLLYLPDVPIDFLVMALDQEGITVSTGTSCKSRSRTPSSAILAMGLGEKRALGVIRLSYPQNFTDAEMGRVVQTLYHAIKKLRS